MFEQTISGMVLVVGSTLSKSVWQYLSTKINCKSADWFLYATSFH